MSPFPVRFEMNGSRVPSGENSGLPSVLGFETSRRASPPFALTVQMSPPDANTISERSGENDGSMNVGLASAARKYRIAAKRSVVRLNIWLSRGFRVRSVNLLNSVRRDAVRKSDGSKATTARFPQRFASTFCRLGHRLCAAIRAPSGVG